MQKTLFELFKSNFQPQLLTVLQEGYRLHHFWSDLLAGTVTGIVALPLAIAFGIASGVTPEQGLYTAIIAGFLISLFSGSRFQIGGPTGAFIVIVYGVVASQGVQGLLLATIISGIMLMAMGLCGLGNLIKYIPYPVTLGFTSGIAIIIATSQIENFFGINLEGEKLPAEFIGKIHVYITHFNTFNYAAFGIAVLSVLIIVFTPKFSLTKRIPASLLAIVVATLLVSIFNIPVDTISDKFGAIETALPKFAFPTLEAGRFSDIFRAAIAIAMLGSIESLLSAVVADGMTGTRHRSNTELVAQGIANVVTPFFGGIPATGAIARTATNIRSGAKTPVSGLIHAVVLLLIVLCFGKMAEQIPLAALAGVLAVVAFNMSEYRLFFKMFRAPKSDVAVMTITFLLTVLLDLTIAIPVGLILAAFMFMHRMESHFGVSVVDEKLHTLSDDDPLEDKTLLRIFEVPDGVKIYELNGPFFFGAASKFQTAIEDNMPRVLILRMRNVPILDASGVNSLEEVIRRAQKHGATIILTGIRPQPMRVLEKFGAIEKIGRENIHATIVQGLLHAAGIVETGYAETGRGG